MPKKIIGENSRFIAARVRKNAAKEEKDLQTQKNLEDEYWKEDDKNILRKQQKKQDQVRKKQEFVEKKATTNALLEEELANIRKKPNKAPQATKLTSNQLSSFKVHHNKKDMIAAKTHLDVPLVENLNRLTTMDGVEAHNVAEAISLLSSHLQEEDVDKNPEKRLKAGHSAYEERRLKILKEEMPDLRLSQLKQMIFKEWQKLSEN